MESAVPHSFFEPVRFKRMTSPRHQYIYGLLSALISILDHSRLPSPQRPDTMAASAALPGLFFCFAACLLLIFVSVSPPTWENVYFLNAGTGAGRIRFGVFGYTGSSTRVGYAFPAPFNGYK